MGVGNPELDPLPVELFLKCANIFALDASM
jgi:hypothetical protein